MNKVSRRGSIETRLITKSVLWRNMFWLCSGTAGSMVATFFYALFAARYLGPLKFGQFALILGVGGWLVAFAQSGGTTALLVLAAQNRDRAGQLLWPGVLIQAGVGIIAGLLSVPTIWVLSHDSSLLWPTALYGLGNTAYLVLSVPISIHRGLDRMEWGTALTAVGFTALLLIRAVTAFNLGFAAVIGATAVSHVLGLFVLFPLASKSFRPSGEGLDKDLFRDIFRRSLAQWGVVMVQSLHWRLGILSVQALAGSYQLGIYTAGSKLVENLRAIPWLLLMVVFPTLAKSGKNNNDALQNVVRLLLRPMLLIAFPLVAVLVILAPIIVPLLFGPKYNNSTEVFVICLFGLVPVFAHWVFLVALISLHQERKLVATYVLSIVGEGILNLVIVPRLGTRGAAFGCLAGECLVALISGLYLRKAIGDYIDSKVVRISVAGLVVLALALVPVPPVTRPVWSASICLLYSLAIMGSKVVTRSDVQWLFQSEHAMPGAQ